MEPRALRDVQGVFINKVEYGLSQSSCVLNRVRKSNPLVPTSVQDHIQGPARVQLEGPLCTPAAGVSHKEGGL